MKNGLKEKLKSLHHETLNKTCKVLDPLKSLLEKELEKQKNEKQQRVFKIKKMYH